MGWGGRERGGEEGGGRGEGGRKEGEGGEGEEGGGGEQERWKMGGEERSQHEADVKLKLLQGTAVRERAAGGGTSSPPACHTLEFFHCTK